MEGQEKRKLCALVIGHKKTSPGAKNARTNLTEFDFNEDLALRIEKKVQKAEIQRQTSKGLAGSPAPYEGCDS